MKKYILIIKTITNDKLSKSLIGGGASVKAPQDIHKIALQNGYEEYPITVSYTHLTLPTILLV